MAVRATDPQTSVIADLTANKPSLERQVLEFLEDENGRHFDHDEIAEAIGRKETSVSSLMHTLCDEGKAHVAGEEVSPKTGKKRMVYAFGPAANWLPGRARPVRQTGHTKLKWTDKMKFTEADIEKMGTAAGKFVDIFTVLLNAEIERRLNA